MKRKIYVETSVVSYLTARPSKNVIEAGHQQSTDLFWDRCSQFDLVASELVVMECNAGDPMAANKRHDALSRGYHYSTSLRSALNSRRA